MIRQPTPSVTPSDVERVVRRDFTPEQFDAVMGILKEYGREKWQREIPRVQLAVLKLANGSLTGLRRSIEVAKTDYRDVLAPAEYPNYAKIDLDLRAQRSEQLERIFDSDWNQYDAWLRRGS
jgi:exosome complex RNA-binding protein Rrp4